MVHVMRDAWQAARTVYYDDINIVDTAEEARAIRAANPQACTLVYSDPHNLEVNDFAITTVTSNGMSRFIVYHATAFNAACARYQAAFKADPKTKLKDPKVKSNPVLIVSDFAVVSKSLLGSLGDYERDDKKRSLIKKGGKTPGMGDSEYALSVNDAPWCPSDDDNGQSRSFSRFAAFAERFERWVLLALCHDPVVGTILTSIARRFENMANKGIVGPGVRLSPEEQARYQQIVTDIKRASVFAAHPELATPEAAETMAQVIQDHVDAAPLVITHRDIPLVPPSITIEAAREFQYAPATHRTVSDLSMIKSNTPMTGHVISMKARIFAGKNPAENPIASVFATGKEGAYERQFHSAEVVETMINTRAYYFPPPQLCMFGPDKKGIIERQQMPTVPVPGYQGRPAVEYAKIAPGTVVCLTVIPSFTTAPEAPANLGFKCERVLAVHGPHQLMEEYRYTPNRAAAVTMPADPRLQCAVSSVSSEPEPVPEESVLGKRTAAEGDVYVPSTEKRATAEGDRYVPGTGKVTYRIPTEEECDEF